MFHRWAVTTKFLKLSSCIHARCLLKQSTWWNKTVYSTTYCTCDKNNNSERKLKTYQQIQKQRLEIQKVQTLTRRTCTEASRAKFSVSGRLVNQGLPAVKIPCPWQQYCIAYNPQGEEKRVFRTLHENFVYQRSWYCKLTTVQRLKSWRFERICSDEESQSDSLFTLNRGYHVKLSCH